MTWWGWVLFVVIAVLYDAAGKKAERSKWRCYIKMKYGDNPPKEIPDE